MQAQNRPVAGRLPGSYRNSNSSSSTGSSGLGTCRWRSRGSLSAPPSATGAYAGDAMGF